MIGTVWRHMSGLPPTADKLAERPACPLCATSRHCRHSLRSASRSYDKLWRKRQVASVRYSPLNHRKDFLNAGTVDVATAASVLRHIFDHRQQSAISVGTGDDLNVYAGET